MNKKDNFKKWSIRIKKFKKAIIRKFGIKTVESNALFYNRKYNHGAFGKYEYLKLKEQK